MSATTSATPTPRSRPKDRRDQIVAAATRLFTERGYHAVRMEDIAEATGITAGALYRHHRNKQALLQEVTTVAQDHWRQVLTDPEGATSRERLHRTLAELATAAIDVPHPALLWQREARHLEPPAYRAVRQRVTWFTDRVRHVVGEVRHDLDPAGLELLGWAVLSVAAGGDRYRAPLHRPEMDRLLASASLAVVDAPVLASRPDQQAPAGGRAPVTRREHLLSAAAALYRRKGYLATSNDEVASEAGMAGPAIYRYFDTKSEILCALVTRFTEWRTLEMFRALRHSSSPEEARRQLVHRYAALALESPDLVGVMFTETLHLPNDVRRVVERRDDEFQDELAAYAGGGNAGRVLAGAARGIIDDLVRIPHLQPQLHPDQLAALADAVLGVGR